MLIWRLASVCVGLCFLLLTTGWTDSRRRRLHKDTYSRIRSARVTRVAIPVKPQKAPYAFAQEVLEPDSEAIPPVLRSVRSQGSFAPTLGLRLAAMAMSMIGKPFCEGGHRPDKGFDCSGLVFYVFGRLGISTPRTIWQQFRMGAPVAAGRLQPGDLLFFSTYADGPTHVGIYVGHGRFVTAERSQGVVLLSSLYDPCFAGKLLCARAAVARHTATKP